MEIMDEDIFMQVNYFMKSNIFMYNESWLKECIQYCFDNHPTLSLKGIQSFAVEQWLLSNLREINHENGCLPKNLTHKKFTTLYGKYILQMEKMYDISTSKYKQLEKIRNVDIENLKATQGIKSEYSEREGKRMFQLFLTDGLQEVQAIEYEPIKIFSETLLPGYKLMLTGPLKCRRGIIMLKNTNISGLGGEIEDLLVSNSTENVLARFLKLNENANPYNDVKVQRENKNPDHDEEFEEYLRDLEKLAQSQEAKDKERRTIDETLTDNELEALLNDSDLVDEFPLENDIQKTVINEKKIDIKSVFKIPSLPVPEIPCEPNLTEKINMDPRKTNSALTGLINIQDFRGDSFDFEDIDCETTGLWDDLKNIETSDCSEKLRESTGKVERSLKILNDDLVLNDKDSVVYGSWKDLESDTSRYYKTPVATPDTTQTWESSYIGSINSFGTSKPYKQLFSKPRSTKLDKSITAPIEWGWEKLENEPNKESKIISNEIPVINSNLMQKSKSLNVGEVWRINTFSNATTLETKNTFGPSQPYKPLFPESCSVKTNKVTQNGVDLKMNKGLQLFSKEIEKFSSSEINLRIKESRIEPISKAIDSDMNSGMENLSNEPHKNLHPDKEQILKSNYKLESIEFPSRLIGTEIKESDSKEIPRRSMKSAGYPSPLNMNQHKALCVSSSEANEENLFSREKKPLVVCDLICDLIKQPLTDQVIRKVVRAKIKQKGKLSNKNHLWHLDGLIFDSTANLEVKFSSKFMGDILGYSAFNFCLIKKEAKTDPELREKIATNMRNAQNRLEQTDWLMELELIKNKTPIVVSGTEVTREQQKSFGKRLKILK